MSALEMNCAAIMARNKIRQLWRHRHTDPNARARMHYWVRVLRLVSPRA